MQLVWDCNNDVDKKVSLTFEWRRAFLSRSVSPICARQEANIRSSRKAFWFFLLTKFQSCVNFAHFRSSVWWEVIEFSWEMENFLKKKSLNQCVRMCVISRVLKWLAPSNFRVQLSARKNSFSSLTSTVSKASERRWECSLSVLYCVQLFGCPWTYFNAPLCLQIHLKLEIRSAAAHRGGLREKLARIHTAFSSLCAKCISCRCVGVCTGRHWTIRCEKKS